MKARAFLDAVRGYNAQPAGSRTPPQDRPPKMGTIDPAYTGLGPAKVKFDGESAVSAKAYVCVNCQVAPSDRVVLIPAGKTLVIIGTIGGSGGGIVPTWAPVITTNAGTYTLGAGGSVTGIAVKNGRVVKATFAIVFGTTPMIGDLLINLPYAAAQSGNNPIGLLEIFDSSAGAGGRYSGRIIAASPTQGRFYSDAVAALGPVKSNALATGSPITADVGDTVIGTLDYISAT